MELNKKERQAFINQFLILEKLYPDDAEYYAHHRKALEEGYELHYDWVFNGLGQGLSSQDCQEVLDILSMYRALNYSYRHLDDKSDIDPEDIKFAGFDGNNESERLGYVRYFIQDLGRFEELSSASPDPDDFNSHMEMLEEHRQRLERWGQCERRNKLSKDEIHRITGR